jgi:O-antigen ligase
MRRAPLVCWVALFWGFAVFFPIGLNYAAFVALAAALAWQGDWRVRVQRLRAQPNWWPAWLFLGWGLLVLMAGAHYPETGSNAFHGLRIVLTLALALALSRDEALWALRGFWAGIAVALVLAGLHLTLGLPSNLLWDSIVRYGGNKSLSNAVLMALAASTGLLLLPLLHGHQRAWALLLATGALAVLGAVLHSRTAWLIVILGLLAGLLHQLRAQRQRQWLTIVMAVALTLGAGLLVPGIRDRLALGAQEITSAYSGEQVSQTSSWGVRFRMYTETLAMVRERPVAGWGIGGWSAQWKARVEPELASANMPHNDFLWMGAQAGLPGALLLLWLVAAGLPRAWRQHDMGGRLAAVALLSMLVAVATNSALRDASIGLSVWFVVLLFQRLSTEPEAVWRQLLPARGARKQGPGSTP